MILLVGVSIILIYSAGSWLWLLCNIAKTGAARIEPDSLILRGEIGLSGLFVLFGVFCLVKGLIYAIKQGKR